MGRRGRRRASGSPREAPAATDYTDDEGNVLSLRDTLSPATLRELDGLAAAAGASQEDRSQRRTEFLFERLALRWTIAGVPLEGQRDLLGRYRLADSVTRAWVGRMLAAHMSERGAGEAT